jgi:hypothetical protein
LAKLENLHSSSRECSNAQCVGERDECSVTEQRALGSDGRWEERKSERILSMVGRVFYERRVRKGMRGVSGCET